MVVSYWWSCDILEWEQGRYPFKSDLFFSLRFMSFYTMNSLKRGHDTGAFRDHPLRSDLFFSVRFVSIYTINTHTLTHLRPGPSGVTGHWGVYLT